MDLGRDVITRTLIGSTDSEKVFTPWWVTLHHYFVYTLVILGLIAVPVNCMLSVNGSCSYKPSAYSNYLLPDHICAVRPNTSTVVIESRFSSPGFKDRINATWHIMSVETKNNMELIRLQNNSFITELQADVLKHHDVDRNAKGCLIRANPRLFGFHIYYACVGKINAIALYFPYLVLTLALILVLLERILTRYLWTGQRIDKFYELLVKEVLGSGDISAIDTKENRQRCQRIRYDFKHSNFYCAAYVAQTAVKLCICLCLFAWSVFDQCNALRESFHTKFECEVFGYMHECSIPSNGMNMIIFDLCNAILFLIVMVATYNMFWHVRFYKPTSGPLMPQMTNASETPLSTDSNPFKSAMRRYKEAWKAVMSIFTPKLTRLVNSYNMSRLTQKGDGGNSISSIHEVYNESPDMQMLLSLLLETEGVWSALLILSLFDASFKNEFKIRDSKISSTISSKNNRRKDVTIAWNEPMAASFLGQNLPTEHLMYVLEIDPPIDDDEDDNITLMPACKQANGQCLFNRIRKTSYLVITDQSPDIDPVKVKPPFERTASSSSTLYSLDSRKSSHSSSAKPNPDKTIQIVDGSRVDNFKKMSKDSLLHLALRKKSTDIRRNFRCTFYGLRSDIDYVIRINFVLSGRTLGSESYTILSMDDCRVRSATPSPKTSVVTLPTKDTSDNDVNRSCRMEYFGDDTNSNWRQNLPVGQPQDVFKSMPLEKGFYVPRNSAELATALRNPHLDDCVGVTQRMVVLQYVARWCGLCSLVKPNFEQMCEEFSAHKKEILFLRVDVDDCLESAKEFGIEVLPTIVLILQQFQASQNQFDDGSVFDNFIGQKLDRIKEHLRTWTQKSQVQEESEDDKSAQPRAGRISFSLPTIQRIGSKKTIT